MDEGAGQPGISRRAFLKRMAAIGFAVPVVSSFALDAAASSDHPHFSLGNQTRSDVPFTQYYANQLVPAIVIGNQAMPNQYEPTTAGGHFFPNQYFGNQV